MREGLTHAAAGSDALSGTFTFPLLEKVIFGPGSVRQLAKEVDRLGGRRVYLLTGNTLANKTDLVDRVMEGLGDRLVGVFARTTAHSPRDSVLEAAEEARSRSVDVLVSFGGGSAADSAKMVALCLAEQICTLEGFDPYFIRYELGDEIVDPVVTRTLIPHIAIPTTLSAAEFTTVAGCTDHVRGVKDLYRAYGMNPKVVIQDPELTVATPGWLWASTGVRAIDHCVETIYSTRNQPFADALAMRALSLLFENLPAASVDPKDVAARGRCQQAAWLALYPLSTVMVGLSHAIGHQLGGQCAVPHGVTSCLMLPAVMDFNRPFAADRLALVAQAMGVDTRNLTDEQAAEAASKRLRDLIKTLGIKSRLRDWGVTEADFARIAEETMHEFLLATNPRRVTGPDEVIGLLRSVF